MKTYTYVSNVYYTRSILFFSMFSADMRTRFTLDHEENDVAMCLLLRDAAVAVTCDR
jgi:hypothetical protein